MFNVEFLHVIREYEYGRIVDQLPKNARVLEIGGGTGYQALRLQEAGFDVVSIDVAESIYSDKLVFPVQPYDGRNFPFPDASFDVVFSSNVLEHVPDLPQMHAESRQYGPVSHGRNLLCRQPSAIGVGHDALIRRACAQFGPAAAWHSIPAVGRIVRLRDQRDELTIQRLIGIVGRLIARS